MRVPGVQETPRSTWPKPAVLSVVKCSHEAGEVADSGSVISTSLFGSAPWSPPPLTVEVIAQIVAVPFGLTRPMRLRRPSVAGDHGAASAPARCSVQAVAEPGPGSTSMSVAVIGSPHSEQRSSTWLIWPQA